MCWLDAVLGLTVVAFSLVGYVLGFSRLGATVFGCCGAILTCRLLVPEPSGALLATLASWGGRVSLAWFLTMVFGFLGGAAAKGLRLVGFGPLDRIAGLVSGAALGALLFLVVYVGGSLVSWAPLVKAFSASYIGPYLRDYGPLIFSYLIAFSEFVLG